MKTKITENMKLHCKLNIFCSVTLFRVVVYDKNDNFTLFGQECLYKNILRYPFSFLLGFSILDPIYFMQQGNERRHSVIIFCFSPKFYCLCIDKRVEIQRRVLSIKRTLSISTLRVLRQYAKCLVIGSKILSKY